MGVELAAKEEEAGWEDCRAAAGAGGGWRGRRLVWEEAVVAAANKVMDESKAPVVVGIADFGRRKQQQTKVNQRTPVWGIDVVLMWFLVSVIQG